MAILPKWYFGESKFATPENNYVGNVNTQMASTLSNLDTKFKLNLQNYNDLLANVNNLALQVRDNNSPIVGAAYQQAKADLQNFQSGAGTSGGEWENASMAVNKALQNYDNNMDLKGAVTDYEQYSNYIAGLQDMKSKGELSDTDYKNAVAYSNLLNTKGVTFDKDTYSFDNIFSGYSPTKTVDLGKQAAEFIEGWKADETPLVLSNGTSVTYKDGSDGAPPGYFITGTMEEVSEDEVLNAVMGQLMAKPENQDWVNQQALWDKVSGATVDEQGNIIYPEKDYKQSIVDKFGSKYGITAEDVDSYIQEGGTAEDLYNMYLTDSYYRDAATPSARKAAYRKRTEKLTENWVQKLAQQHANDLDKMDKEYSYKKSLIDYEERVKNPVYSATVESSLQATDNYDAKGSQVLLKEQKAQLDALKSKINSGINVTAEDMAAYESGLKEYEINSAIETKRIDDYLTTNPNPELDALYNEYVNGINKLGIAKKAKSIGSDNTAGETLTKAEFAQILVENAPSTKLGENKDWLNHIANTIVPIVGPMLFTEEFLRKEVFNGKTDAEIVRSVSTDLKNNVEEYAKNNKTALDYDLYPVTGDKLTYVNNLLDTEGKISVLNQVGEDGKKILTFKDYEAKNPMLQQYYDRNVTVAGQDGNLFKVTYTLKDDLGDAFIDENGNLKKGSGDKAITLIKADDLQDEYSTFAYNIGNTSQVSTGGQFAYDDLGEIIANTEIGSNTEIYTDLENYPELFGGDEGLMSSYKSKIIQAANSNTFSKPLDILGKKETNGIITPAVTVAKNESPTEQEVLNGDTKDATKVNSLSGKTYVIYPGKVGNETVYYIARPGTNGAEILKDTEGNLYFENSIPDLKKTLQTLEKEYDGSVNNNINSETIVNANYNYTKR